MTTKTQPQSDFHVLLKSTDNLSEISADLMSVRDQLLQHVNQLLDVE
jgi:hypothetical protein